MDRVAATFSPCALPWSIWPWGLDLRHSDTDTSLECVVEFGAMVVRPAPPYEELWVAVEFHDAAYACAKPHKDDERIEDVTGYVIRGRESDDEAAYEAEWLASGVCPDPYVYFTTDSPWLDRERGSWAARQRTNHGPEDAVHFLLNGRDGYIEILASNFSWRAWTPGHPRLNEVSGPPLMSGEWLDRPRV